MTAVNCQHVTKTFNKGNALNDLSCTFAENTITGLIGSNGAGKTTLLKIIAGFVMPTKGQVTVWAQKPFNNLQVSANSIMIDEKMVFSSSASLEKIFNQAAIAYPNWDQTLANNLLAYFSLDPKQFPHNLSKGMASTFRSILGLCAHAPLTILDEPTSGMDAAVRQDFYRMLLKDYMAHPRTIILSSHLVNEIEELIEDIVLIHQGTHILSAPVSDMQSYAVMLTGKADTLSPLLKNKTILYQETPLPNLLKVAVSNHFTDQEWQQMQALGIERSSVSANNLCIYLTKSKDKGGIDHVFEQSIHPANH